MFVTTANFPIQDETHYIPNGKLPRSYVVDVIDLIKDIIRRYRRVNVYDLIWIINRSGIIDLSGDTKYEFVDYMVRNGWRSAKFWIPIYIPKKGWHIMMPKPKNLY